MYPGGPRPSAYMPCLPARAALPCRCNFWGHRAGCCYRLSHGGCRFRRLLLCTLCAPRLCTLCLWHQLECMSSSCGQQLTRLPTNSSAKCAPSHAQVWTEYKVIKETSALTFMIAGTVKEVVSGEGTCCTSIGDSPSLCVVLSCILGVVILFARFARLQPYSVASC